MDCKELENKLLELKGKQSEDKECLTGCLVVTALIAASAIVGGILSAYEQGQRLERLEHMQGIDAIGRRVK
jgi:hypothetical protein